MESVRTWIVRTARRLLGTDQLQAQLQQTNELLRQLNALLSVGQVQPVQDGAALAGENPVATARRLAEGGLFLVGCARSGTTILTRCLNCAPQLLLLEEPFFFLHQDVADFARFFNDRHSAMGDHRQKGLYVPPAIAPEFGPLGLVRRLQQGYRYVGEKVAFGPQDFPGDWCRRYLDFQSRHFLHARYLFILRTPVDVVWSMHQRFPDRPVPRLFETWLRTTALILDACQLFGNSRVIFFDDLGPPLFEKISKWLEQPITVPAGAINARYIHSAVWPGELPEPLIAFEPLCERVAEIYDHLRASFSSEELVYGGPNNHWFFFDAMHQRMNELLAELAEPVTGPPEAQNVALRRFRFGRAATFSPQ